MRLSGMVSSWRNAPVAVRDAVGAVMLVASALLPLGIPGLELGGLHRTVPAWAAPVLAVAQTLPLTFRRIRPDLVLVVVGVAFAAAQLGGVDSGPAALGLLVALYSTGAYQENRRVGVAASATAGYVLLAVALDLAGSPERLLDWITFSLVLATPWTAGLLVRRRLREQGARELLAAQEGVRQARNELARDLHDIVTHHITAMVIQSESAAYLEPDDSAGRGETLEVVGRTGRQALHELRTLLETLDQVAAGGPGVAPFAPVDGDVRGLVEQLAVTGYPARFTEIGNSSETSHVVSTTLHRVAQEAITNAMKHAPGEQVAVTLRHGAESVELLVENRTTSRAPGRPGRGLRGMTERVALAGGTIEIGLVDEVFHVRAMLSFGSAR